MLSGNERRFILNNPQPEESTSTPTMHSEFCLVEWGNIDELHGSKWNLCGYGSIGIVGNETKIEMRRSTSPGVIEMDFMHRDVFAVTVSLVIDRHPQRSGWRPWLVGSTQWPDGCDKFVDVVIYVFRLLDHVDTKKRCILLEFYLVEGSYVDHWPPLCAIADSTTEQTAPKDCKELQPLRKCIRLQDEIGTGHER